MPMTLMGDLYRRIARPLLFRVGGGDPEAAHELSLRWLGRLGGVARLLPPYSPSGAASTVFGIRFPNPVGLAAGMDKDGCALASWHALGFGFVEVGTVTRHPQPGNDGLRLVRLPESQAIINRLGFPNAGAASLASRLDRGRRPPIPIGVSLGKSKITDVAHATNDYVASVRALYRHGDYFVVNVSSPNTPGLRDLQDRGFLHDLLSAVIDELRRLAGDGLARGGLAGDGRKPVLVKVAPDLTETALGELLAVCVDRGVDGVVATNTTVDRRGLSAVDAGRASLPGGLSGAPLAGRAREVVRFVVRETAGRLPVIGVGGVGSPDDAVRLLDAGASLIQVYTGLVYSGPALIRSCVRSLADHEIQLTQ
jgi:dihydroorotate dehydrogenase